MLPLANAFARRRWQATKRRLTALARDEAGYTTETVVVTAILVAIAIAVLAVFRDKLIAKVNSLNLGFGDSAPGVVHDVVATLFTMF